MVNELLCPAGSLEAVKVAIDNGADAVYCAGLKFGARSFIANLSDDDIIEASHYAHLYGRKIYITLNTLIFESEIEEVKSYIDFLYQYVDAIIVQDYGVVHYIRSHYPAFPVHLSTQTSIHNIEDVLFLKKLGISRVVLAREVSLKEIKLIQEAGIELEVFIHGALCFSYSGMCYLSYYKGGRSGNRGSCAQPCRQNYELLEDGNLIKSGPLLSMKDLNTIRNIEPLLSAGITSLKIEGRAKSLEYVTSVTRVYRKLIDDFNAGKKPVVSSELLDDLYTSFSRETTTGYLFEDSNKNVTTDYSVKHKGIHIGKVLSYKNNQVKIKLSKPLEILDGIRIVDGDKEVGTTVTRIIENGQLVKSSRGVVIVDIKGYVKEGSDVYKTQSGKLVKEVKNHKNTCKTPAKLNILIKQGYQKLTVEIDDIVVSKSFNKSLEKAKTINEENVVSQFKKTNNLPISYDDVSYINRDNLFIPIPVINEMRRELLNELQETLENRKMRDYHEYPFKDGLFVNQKSLDDLELSDYQNHLINNGKLSISPLAFHLSEVGPHSHISPYFGVANSLAVSFFRNLTDGVIILSYESTLANSLELSRNDKNLGYLVDYKEPLMVAKHCVVAKAYGYEEKGCGMCNKHHYQLRDNDRIYDLSFHNCIMRIEGKNIKRPSTPELVNVTLK